MARTANTERNERVRAFILAHPTEGLSALAEACDCSRSLISKIRGELVEAGEVQPLPQGFRAHGSTALVVAKVDEGNSAERIAELEEENLSYQHRVLELLELVASLSMENVRLTNVIRERDDA
jgi:hypothetical protein